MRYNLLLSSFVLLILATGVASAQGVPAPLSAQQKRAKYLELQQAIQRSFAQRQYDQAEKQCIELTELAPKDPGAQYNLACAARDLERSTNRSRHWKRPWPWVSTTAGTFVPIRTSNPCARTRDWSLSFTAPWPWRPSMPRAPTRSLPIWKG